MNREQLNEKARKAGVEAPEQLDTKADVQRAIQAAEQGAKVIGAVVVIQKEDGFAFQTDGFKATELPTVLRLAAKEAEKTLGAA